MKVRPRPIVLVAATLLLALRGAVADDAPPKEAKPSKAAKAPATKGEEIAWRPQWTEAAEEAAERGILVMLHSHGST